MTYYPGLKRASEEQKQQLIREIDLMQKGNESRFCGNLSEFPVSLKKLNAHAKLIGRSFKPAKPQEA